MCLEVSSMEWPTKDKVTQVIVENIVGEGKKFSDLSDSWFTKHLIIAIREAVWLFILVAQGVYGSLTVAGSTGAELDDKGYDYGVDRNAAKKALHLVTFEKTLPQETDFLIPDGFLVTTTPIANGSPIKFTVVSGQNKVIPAGSKTVDDVIVECSEFGLVGNVGDGEINLIAQAGIDRVTNSRLYSKGADQESDADYRERIWDKRRRPEKAGTPADWEGWAKEVSGVKRATCFRAARGPGTVDIMILGPDGSFPGQGLLDEVKDYLVEKYLPADMKIEDLVVAAPEKVSVEIVLTSVIFSNGYDMENAEPIIQSAIHNCLTAATKEVKIVDIITAIAMACDAQDASRKPVLYDFVLANPTANIALDARQMAALDKLTIEV